MWEFARIKVIVLSKTNCWGKDVYKWATRTKFLLTIIYRSPLWHSNSSNSSKTIFIIILGLSESFKIMNRSDPTRPDPARRDCYTIWRLISWTMLKIGMWNFGTIFISNHHVVLLKFGIVLWSRKKKRVCVFQHCNNYGHFSAVFRHKFRLKRKFLFNQKYRKV